MKTLSTLDASRLLKLNVKAVQRMAREGSLPAFRVGRKWLFHHDQLQRLLGRGATQAEAPVLELSARNRLQGTIARVQVDGLMAILLLMMSFELLLAVRTSPSGFLWNRRRVTSRPS